MHTRGFQTFKDSKVHAGKVVYHNSLLFHYFILMRQKPQKNWGLIFGTVPNIGLDFLGERR
jgi:hypothetical protein